MAGFIPLLESPVNYTFVNYTFVNHPEPEVAICASVTRPFRACFVSVMSVGATLGGPLSSRNTDRGLRILPTATISGLVEAGGTLGVAHLA